MKAAPFRYREQRYLTSNGGLNPAGVNTGKAGKSLPGEIPARRRHRFISNIGAVKVDHRPRARAAARSPAIQPSCWGDAKAAPAHATTARPTKCIFNWAIPRMVGCCTLFLGVAPISQRVSVAPVAGWRLRDGRCAKHWLPAVPQTRAGARAFQPATSVRVDISSPLPRRGATCRQVVLVAAAVASSCCKRFRLLRNQVWPLSLFCGSRARGVQTSSNKVSTATPGHGSRGSGACRRAAPR